MTRLFVSFTAFHSDSMVVFAGSCGKGSGAAARRRDRLRCADWSYARAPDPLSSGRNIPFDAGHDLLNLNTLSGRCFRRAVVKGLLRPSPSAATSPGAVAKPIRMPPPAMDGTARPCCTALERVAPSERAKRRDRGLSRQAIQQGNRCFPGTGHGTQNRLGIYSFKLQR